MNPSTALNVLGSCATATLYLLAATGIGSIFALVLFRGAKMPSLHDRVVSFYWISFILGQGVLGVLWLFVSLVGIFYGWLTWLFLIGGIILFIFSVWFRRYEIEVSSRKVWYALIHLPLYSIETWILLGGILVVSLLGFRSIVPTTIDDALVSYLVTPKLIAFMHKYDFLPTFYPMYGLAPMQVEMHWAALFTIRDDIAVQIFDYFCALSLIFGIYLLGCQVTASRKIGFYSALIMLTTNGYFFLVGGAKTDIAGAQYGIATYLILSLMHHSKRNFFVFFAGLTAGWCIASRYTNVIIIPGIAIYSIYMLYQNYKESTLDARVIVRAPYILEVTYGILGIVLAFLPMLVKNQILVGCPLAPQIGCTHTYWYAAYQEAVKMDNITWQQFLIYPFVWTFTEPRNMMGNISPLYLGLLPFLFFLPKQNHIHVKIVGLVGLSGLVVWWFIQPLTLNTRYLLIPLALIAIPLSAIYVYTYEKRANLHFIGRALMPSAILILVLFFIFQCWTATRGVQYFTGTLTRDQLNARKDESYPPRGTDVANWLNVHIKPNERVVLTYFRYKYFIRPDILLNAEKAGELQWIFENKNSTNILDYYRQQGFDWVVLPTNPEPANLQRWFVHKGTEIITGDILVLPTAYRGNFWTVYKLNYH